MLQAKNQKRIDAKIKSKIFDDEVENYIYNLSGEDISRKMQFIASGFSDILFKFMDIDDSHAQHIIQSVDQAYQSVCGRSFEAYDVYSSFAKRILSEDYSFVVKEIAANILRYIAWDVNRFSAQHMIEDVISAGIEPLLEDIIRS